MAASARWPAVVRCQATHPIDKSGDAYFAWIFVISASFLYNMYSIPLRMAFEQVQSQLWMISDYTCDILYLLDIGLNFLISTPRLGLPQQDLEHSRQAYMKSWTFKLDVLAVLPTDLVFILRTAEGAIVGVRMNRMLKFHRMSEWFDRIIGHSSYPIVFRFGRMLCYILMLIHLTSCSYYAMNVYIGFGSDNWTIPLRNDTEGNFINLYVRSFHWATVILSDDGDNSEASLVIELAYRCMVTLQGHILVGSVIAIVASIFGTVNVKESRFRHQLDGIKKYMQFRHVDRDMQDRVFKWASFMWEGKKFRDSERDLEVLPVPLRRVIAQAAHMDTFQRVKLFDDCEPQFLEELIMRLELQVFSPGDLIIRKGDVGREMYVCRTGTLQVVSDEGQVFASLGQGSVFGEISLLSSFTKQENRRTANIRSFSYSELFSLSSANFKEVLENFPLARRKMIAKSRELLKNEKDRSSEMAEAVHNDADDDDELHYKVETLAELAQDIVLLIETFTKTIIEDTTKMKKRLAALEYNQRRHPPPAKKPRLILFAQTPV